MKISVCMAAYNGAKRIGGQITSILGQLRQDDELIIVDDSSSDDTVSIIEGFADSRIKLFRNAVNLGATRSFDKALGLANGDIIFLSDQDDVWYELKVSTVLSQFIATDIDIVVHNAHVTNDGVRARYSLFEICKSSPSLIRNLISSTHTGCCMALRRSALIELLPIPSKKGIFHDAWLGVLSSCLGQKKCFLDLPLIEYRRHSGNVSTMQRRSLLKIIPERINLLSALLARYMRIIIGRTLANLTFKNSING